MSLGKFLDQRAKAAFDLARFDYFESALMDKFIDGKITEQQFSKEWENIRFEKGLQVNPIVNRERTTLSKTMAWEGTLIKNVMTITSLLSITFTVVDIIQSATSKDPTQAKLDFIVQTVDQINSTVTQTLEEVRGVQVSARSIPAAALIEFTGGSHCL